MKASERSEALNVLYCEDIEHKDQTIEAIYHSEGRIFNTGTLGNEVKKSFQ